MKKPIVINLFGGPGTGKSTGAAFLFSQLKIAGYNVELVTEFAKEKAWEHNPKAISDQLYVLGEQSHRMTICQDDVDIIITDSPLLLSILYCHDERLTDSFTKTVLDVFNYYNNFNFYLERTKKYDSNGRFQDEDGAKQLDVQILNLLNSYNIKFDTYKADIADYTKISEYIQEYLKNI